LHYLNSKEFLEILEKHLVEIHDGFPKIMSILDENFLEKESNENEYLVQNIKSIGINESPVLNIHDKEFVFYDTGIVNFLLRWSKVKNTII
jgi:hypothetical protein